MLATYVPFGVALTSGSAARLPIRKTLLTIESPPRICPQGRFASSRREPRLFRGKPRSRADGAPGPLDLKVQMGTGGVAPAGRRTGHIPRAHGFAVDHGDGR